MCLALRMGNCTCFATDPESSSSNLTNSNTLNHAHVYDMDKASYPTRICNKIKPNDIRILDINPDKTSNTKSDIFPINEEKQEQTNNHNNISPKNNNNIAQLSQNNIKNISSNHRLRPQQSGNVFQQIEHSQSTTNMTTPTAKTPSNLSTLGTTPDDATDIENYYAQIKSRNASNASNATINGLDENEPMDENTSNHEIYKNLEKQQNQTSINILFSKIKSKKKTRKGSLINHDYTPSMEPMYHKAPSTETQSSTIGVDIIFIDDKKMDDIDNEDDDNDSDSPGPLPTLKLFNNSNKPPVWGKKRTSSIDSIASLNININDHQYNELTRTRTATDTPTLTSRTSRADTIDRLRIPPMTTLNKSVSAFDELGKKLNRLPSFHRALTSASITSLTSMHSTSIQLSKSMDNAKLTNAPSFHSIHSLRTPTGNSLLKFDTFGHTNSINISGDSILSNPFGHVTPLTHSQIHGNVSFDNISILNKAAMSPSLPSISDKGVINIQHTESYSKSMSTNKDKIYYKTSSINNRTNSERSVNPADLVQKRVLFVSLVQLHRAYLNGIPDFILEHSIFAFGVKRIWIFPATSNEINEAKDSYIDYFKQSWSKEFIDIIKQKDEKGHVLWIEPCQSPQVWILWNKINEQLKTIIDLSVSEEETMKKKLEVEARYKKVLTEQKIQDEKQKTALAAVADAAVHHDMIDYLSDNDGVSRFPSDRTDTIPNNLPTMSNQFDTSSVTSVPTKIGSLFSGSKPVMDTVASSIVRHTSSLDIVPSPMEFNINDIDDMNEDEIDDNHSSFPTDALNKHQPSISEQLLTGGTFDTTVLLYEASLNENEMDDSDTDSKSENDDENNDLPGWNNARSVNNWPPVKKPAAIKVNMTMLKDNNDTKKNVNITPPEIIKHTKSRQSKPILFDNNNKKIDKKMKIKVDNISEIKQEDFMPYYKGLKLEDEFWIRRYEPIRTKQAEQQKLCLAQSAKLIKPSLSMNPSPHHNESINLLNSKIKSLFNIEGKEVLRQLKCITTASDIKLKPIKELFYQSNPTMIPIEYFNINYYMEAHIDLEETYNDLLQYCYNHLVDRNGIITPSHSMNTNSQSSVQNTTTTNNGNCNSTTNSSDSVKRDKTQMSVPRLHNDSDSSIMLFDSSNNSRQKPKIIADNNGNNNIKPNLNLKMEMIAAEEDNYKEEDGFKMIDQPSNTSHDDNHNNLDIIHEINVDDSGMVYMLNYDDDPDDDLEDESEHDATLALLSNLSPKRSLQNRWSTNPSVPMLHNDSESSIMLFD